jgi:hypothetical protein
MGIRAKIRDKLKKETVTKIHGQPTCHDLTILEKEIIAILANIPTALGGGNHQHAGIIMEPAMYSLMTGGTAFIIPVNPRHLSNQISSKCSTRDQSQSKSRAQRAHQPV